MSSRFKKYLIFIILISLSYTAYWYFFSAHWGIVIDKEHQWNYGFQEKNITTINNVNWEDGKIKENISDENKTKNLLFQTTFNLEDYTSILEGSIEYNFRYSVKIFVNSVEYAHVNRNLITPSIENNEIFIHEYWRPKKIKLEKEFLQNHLVNGENTITLLVLNVQELKSLEQHKKQLALLEKGRNNHLKSSFKLEKAPGIFKESTLPIFKINTYEEVIPDDPKIKASLDIINTAKGVNELTDPSIFYNIKIERRGNTSQSFAKKSYSFNVCDTNYKKMATSLLGLPSSKRWVLYGPYADKSLIRNALTYSLYNQMGNYAPRTQFIDLVINDNYQGIYMLTERIQISPNHINIPPLKEHSSDSIRYQGGYILEIDRNPWKSNYPPKSDSSTTYPVSFYLYSPRMKKITPELEGILRNQFNDFEKRIYENNNIYDVVDINSFVDYLIITELTRNIDGYCLSTFLYNENIKNDTPKFYIGPIWDYNFSFGLTNYHDGYKPEGYVYNSNDYIPFWWDVLLKDSIFSKQLESRYFELRKETLSIQQINATIDSLYSICQKSSDLNFKKWPVLNSKDLWPNYYLGETYYDEIDYLKNWTKKRLKFLDNGILAKNKRGVQYYEIAIRNDQEWMESIKEKARDKNISLEEMIKIDANYMAKKE